MWLDTLGKWKSGCWVVFARGITLPSGTWCRTVGPVVMCQNMWFLEFLSYAVQHGHLKSGHDGYSLRYGSLSDHSNIKPDLSCFCSMMTGLRRNWKEGLEMA
jgi:hypothetical protein